MAFGLSGSLSACFMYIFALMCASTEWQIKMLACLLTEDALCQRQCDTTELFICPLTV